MQMQEYRKKATVKAKLFERGDEDGYIGMIPFISTLENNKHQASKGFEQYYICVGVRGERWLVEKSIFEETYERI